VLRLSLLFVLAEVVGVLVLLMLAAAQAVVQLSHTQTT
jgi:hypothetical protein